MSSKNGLFAPEFDDFSTIGMRSCLGVQLAPNPDMRGVRRRDGLVTEANVEQAAGRRGR